MARLNVTVPSVEFSMSQSVTFTPQYAQPFTLQEATGLELDSLIAGKWLWLQRSTRRLTGSRGESGRRDVNDVGRDLPCRASRGERGKRAKRKKRL